MEILPADIDQIAQWGMEADGEEICGVLLTRSDAGPRLMKIPNLADEPRRSIFMTSDHVIEAICTLIEHPETYPGSVSKDLVVWHTHPGGLVGPSEMDLAFRDNLAETRCLVVTIPSGEAVQF